MEPKTAVFYTRRDQMWGYIDGHKWYNPTVSEFNRQLRDIEKRGFTVTPITDTKKLVRIAMSDNVLTHVNSMVAYTITKG